MRKTLLYLAIGILGCMVNVQAEQKITVTGNYTLGTGMSPNGKYVVGYNPMYYVYGIYAVSYFYNIETGDLKWLTEFDEDDYGKSGQFYDVSDDGIIAGTAKDLDYLVNSYGEIAPLCMAAVWKDGQVTSLGLGEFSLSDFQQPEDGSFANARLGCRDSGYKNQVTLFYFLLVNQLFGNLGDVTAVVLYFFTGNTHTFSNLLYLLQLYATRYFNV